MGRYSIRHDPLAPDELQEAADWYEEQAPGTGTKFIQAVKTKLVEIRTNPYRWALEKDGTRHALVRPFKYTVVFRVRDEAIEIIAYAHTSRRPRYWRKRLRD
jgi:toxin ParE1/3/4